MPPSDPIHLYEIGPGKILGDRFEVRHSNRQGGMGVAFAAWDRRDEAERELQFFPPSLFEGEREAQEFAAGWEPWRRVDSENVLRVHDIALVGPDALLVATDLPPGKSLRELIEERAADGRKARFSEAEVVEVGMALLDGLSALHGQGLVHGDVKPQTVWVDPDNLSRPVLVDGGTTPGLWSAKDLGERTALIGTPYYAPVEQFGGDAPDVQSDVYNLATLLFELATGVQPWRGRNFLEVFQAKLEPEPPRASELAPEANLSAELETALRGGLFADRKKRHSSAADFKAALSEAASA